MGTNELLSPEDMQRHTRTIAFCGREDNAFIYFTALLLRAAKKRVLVIDNSRDNCLYSAVANGEDASDVIRQNITYIKNRKYYHTEHSFFDYVLIWQGLEVREEELKQSDMIVLLPSYEPEVLKIISPVSKFERRVVAVFMVNATNHNKINDIQISEKLKVSKEKILSAIPYDLKDYEAYLSFLYNGYHDFNGLSSDYKMCIMEVARLIMGVDKKQVKSLIRKSNRIRKEKVWS